MDETPPWHGLHLHVSRAASCTTSLSYVILSKNSFSVANAPPGRKRMQRYYLSANPPNIFGRKWRKNEKFSDLLTKIHLLRNKMELEWLFELPNFAFFSHKHIIIYIASRTPIDTWPFACWRVLIVKIILNFSLTRRPSVEKFFLARANMRKMSIFGSRWLSKTSVFFTSSERVKAMLWGCQSYALRLSLVANERLRCR